MIAMKKFLGLDNIEGIRIEGIRKSPDPTVYCKTQPLFLGHFQEVGAPASVPWSIIRTDQAIFHYKGAPDGRSEPKKKEQSSSQNPKSPGFILIIEHHVVTFYFAVIPDVPLASHAGVLSVLRE